MSRLIRIALAFLLLCLSATAQTEIKNELGLLLGAGLVPQRTTAAGQAINFGASIAFSADYARLIKDGKTSLSIEFPFVAEPANSVQSTNLPSIVSLATILVVPSVRVHRADFSVHYKRVEREAYLLLSGIQDGLSVSDALDPTFTDSGIAKEVQASQIEQWFGTWMSLGWFCKSNTIG
jgi:hypothetical protein